MSAVNGDGKGNLLISFTFNSNNYVEQIKEEAKLKKEISKFLSDKGYHFLIADDDMINEKLINN